MGDVQELHQRSHMLQSPVMPVNRALVVASPSCCCSTSA